MIEQYKQLGQYIKANIMLKKNIASISRLTKSFLLATIDVLLFPIILIIAPLLKYLRIHRLKKFPIIKKTFLRIGVLPIVDHYYEPLFNPKHLHYSLNDERFLPGIDLNDVEQLTILNKFNYVEELLNFPIDKTNDKLEYYYNNFNFESGDSEYWYNIIRTYKPKKIIEIGSGFSTLMARNAIRKNNQEKSCHCEHICIEPFEQPWLEKLGIKIIREKVECVDKSIFNTLTDNDILFIDSSHIIRPQGDVLYEYLEILPILNKNVIVHIHDIFTPRDYPENWLTERLWNEQYLLEAFLSCNKEFRIIGAANYLSKKYYEDFSSKCPVYKKQNNRKLGSFYIIKN